MAHIELEQSDRFLVAVSHVEALLLIGDDVEDLRESLTQERTLVDCVERFRHH